MSVFHIDTFNLVYMKSGSGSGSAWMLFFTLHNECVGPSSFSSLVFWYHTAAELRLPHTEQKDTHRVYRGGNLSAA